MMRFSVSRAEQLDRPAMNTTEFDQSQNLYIVRAPNNELETSCASIPHQPPPSHLINVLPNTTRRTGRPAGQSRYLT